MTTQKPLISICVPVYNGVTTLEQTIRSILQQTESDFEILIQDNQSTDETPALIERLASLDARIFQAANATNLGMVGNWNTVMSRARGTFVMLLSADDLLTPRFLERALGAFDEDSIFAVSTDHTLFSKEGERRRKIRIESSVYANHAGLVLLKNPFSINFTIFRRVELAAFETRGNVFRRFLSCDYDLHLRIALSGRKVRYLDETLGRYRLHDANLSRAKRRMNRHASLTVLGLRKKLSDVVPFILKITMLRFLLRTWILPLRGERNDSRLARVLRLRLLGGR